MAKKSQVRDNQLGVMLSGEEWEYVGEEADALGITRSAFVRMLLLADKRKKGARR